MLYTTLADLALLAHLAFVAFVVIGGAVVLRWPRLAWVHLPAVLWAVLIEYAGWICPLTPLENALRQAGGEAAYAGGFIDLSSRGCLCPSYGEGSGHPCDRSCCPEQKRASGQARGPLAVVRSTGHWGGAPALYWFFFQVSSTVTGIWFLIGIVSREGGSILKSESVAGIVPVIRVSSPEVVTSNRTCL